MHECVSRPFWRAMYTALYFALSIQAFKSRITVAAYAQKVWTRNDIQTAVIRNTIPTVVEYGGLG